MIIVIEDKKHFAKSLQQKLERNWYEVKVYHSTSEYIHEEAELYIIDICLEVQSYALIRKIRHNTHAPIIIFTAFNNNEYIKKALEAWWDVHEDKLVAPQVFLQKVKSLILMYKRLKWQKW